MRRRVILAALKIVAGFAACTKQVAVGTAFPSPVMSRLSARVALHLTAELRQKTHEETLPSGESWRIALGEANARFFEQVSSGMFAAVVAVNEARAAGEVAAVLEPVIEKYQFSTPERSQTDYYEAWFRYQMRVHAPDGRLVASLPFTGYGRSEKRTFGAVEALREATEKAMRDAAAVLVLELPREPAVRALLDGPPPPGEKGAR